MPGLARLDAPGVLHHIMIRGIERRKIFLNQLPLATLMRRLLTGYAVSFNRRHNRPCQSSLTGQAWPTVSLRGAGSTLRPVSPTGWKRSRRQNRYPS